MNGLQLYKRDEQNHGLKGITFRIKATDGRYIMFNKYTHIYAGLTNDTIPLDAPTNNTTELVTGDDGNAPLLRRLPLGLECKVYEVDVGIYENLYDKNENNPVATGTIRATANGIMYQTIKNVQKYGALTIVKREKKTQVPLAGFGFKIHVQGEGWLQIDSQNRATYYNVPYDEATLIKTDSNGKTCDILKLNLSYKYDVCEVFIPEEYREYFTLASIYGGTERIFDITTKEKMTEDKITKDLKDFYIAKDIQLNKGVQNIYPYDKSVITYATNLTSSELGKLKEQLGREVREQDKYIANKQTYVSISGKVWEEKSEGKSTTKSDNEYTSGNDYLLNKVQVSLIDKDNNIVKIKDPNGTETPQQTTTKYLTNNERKEDSDSNGAYVFNYVVIDKLNDYRVRFTYDGYTYENVVPFANGSALELYPKENTSKVSENYYSMDRNTFNQKWKYITGSETQTINNGTENVALKYQKNEDETVSLKKGTTIGLTSHEINNRTWW